MTKKWVIVSWQQQDLLDGRYGKCLDMIEGTYDEACEAAKEWLAAYSPISVCGILEPTTSERL